MTWRRCDAGARVISVIEIVPAHAEVLSALHRQGFAGNEHLAIGNLVALADAPGVVGLMAVAGEAPAGFVLARLVADEAEILTIVVNPQFRRRGIGKILLAEAIRRAALDGGAAMFLEVAEDNTEARGLYAGMGFQSVGMRRNYYGPGRHALVLRRDMDAADREIRQTG